MASHADIVAQDLASHEVEMDRYDPDADKDDKQDMAAIIDSKKARLIAHAKAEQREEPPAQQAPAQITPQQQAAIEQLKARLAAEREAGAKDGIMYGVIAGMVVAGAFFGGYKGLSYLLRKSKE